MSVLPLQQQLDLYSWMLTSRAIDDIEMELVNSGEAFFHIPAKGHEGAAILGFYLQPDDWLHCHYRAKALMLARGIPPEMFFHSLLCTVSSHSAGRQMSVHMSDPGHRILSIVGPVGNNGLQAAGVAAEVKSHRNRPIVLCGVGDGTTQQGEVLEAIGEAVRSTLPVLFWVEDNRLAISTTTHGRTFYDLPSGKAGEFYGLPIHRFNGLDAVGCAEGIEKLVAEIRQTRGPALAVFQVERLANHTNADDERVYRTAEEIEKLRRTCDPITILSQRLVEQGISVESLEQMNCRVVNTVRRAAEACRRTADPIPSFVSKRELSAEIVSPTSEYRGDDSSPRLTMLEAMREVLRIQLAANPRITLYGEDIEDPKGDVFGITRGLSQIFPGRVINSALSESTIVGVSIGRALAGGRPVAFIQFADFLPLAFNQIMSEMASMEWRTNGGWRVPVIVMVTCGGYRPGLGPFHAQTNEGIVAHVPGIDVFMPCTAADAAGMLNAAFASERPTIFFYPKVCLNDRDYTTSLDVARQFIPVGRARLVCSGTDLTMVSWGSTVSHCERAAQALATIGLSTDLIDLRSISPWDRDAVCASAKRTGRLLVVHEDNLTCGFGAEVVAYVAQTVQRRVLCRRVTRPDTWVPCNFPNQLEVLPSFRRILSAAAELVGIELGWEFDANEANDLFVVEARGSSPADQTLTVVEWLVSPGDDVRLGQPLADAEADKAVLQICAPVPGVVERILAPNGQSVRVGSSLAHLRSNTVNGIRKRPTREDVGKPILRRAGKAARSTSSSRAARRAWDVGISTAYSVHGSATLTNDELIRRFPTRSHDDIMKRTGIESRPLITANESALTMAVAAARRALESERLEVSDLGALICSTTTPFSVTPSMACRILNELCGDGHPHAIPAFDVNAACSGFLYALATGYDHLQANNDSKVLVVTTEAMSTVVDPNDFDTAILFGDAATATVLYGSDHDGRNIMRLHRPFLSARGEDGKVLSVPNAGCGFLKMDGRKVFAEAIRKMIAMLEHACADAEITVPDLRLIIPHQANGRIIEAVRERVGFSIERVANNIRFFGNTSSSSIPLCLADLQGTIWPGDRIGLCAFGGGFTYAAAIIEVPGPA